MDIVEGDIAVTTFELGSVLGRFAMVIPGLTAREVHVAI
jgi:hypothetical protein